MNYSEILTKHRNGPNPSKIEVQGVCTFSELDLLEICRISANYHNIFYLKELVKIIRPTLEKSTAIKEYKIDLDNF